MGLFSFFKANETRADIAEENQEKSSEIISIDGLLNAMRGNDTVTVADAMEVPCFSSCVSFLSSTVAMLPIKLYREGKGETAEITDDIRIRLLNDETGDLLDSFQMKAAFVADYLVHGNGYIYIDSYQNEIKGLYYVKASDVSYQVSPDPIFKSAMYMIGGKRYDHYKLLSLLRNSKNGVYGTGVFDEGKEVIATAYNTKVFQHYSVLNGGNKSGFLQSQSKLSNDALETLKEKWKLFRSNKNKEPLVLNNGLEFKETSATSVEMQLNESIRTNNEEICLLFGLSPDIISGRASEDQFSDAVRTAVQPILEAFQVAINRQLLLESEKGSMYFAFDTTELLKGDILKRYQAYQIALQSNFMQIDEVRYKEDLPKIGFNYVKLGLSDVLLDIKNNTVYTPNTNQCVRIGTEGLKSEVEGGIIEKEERYNPYHDSLTGRFISGGVDFSGESGIISENNKTTFTEITENAISNVSKIIIPEYTDKQCSFICEQHKELLKYAQELNGGNEVAFIFRKDLSDKAILLGTNNIEFGTTLVGKGSDLFVMHNHPRNSSFSLNDLNLFINSELKTLTVVKNNGNLEYITKSKDCNIEHFKMEYRRLYKKIVINGTDTEKDKFIKSLLRKNKSGIEWGKSE